MLITLAIVLCPRWSLGLSVSLPMGGLIHVLPALAMVMWVIRRIQKRRLTA